MKKGIVFSIIGILLFSILLAAVLAYANEKQEGEINEMASEKVGYALDDVDDGILDNLDLIIVKNGTKLVFNDTLPANDSEIQDNLIAYGLFTTNYYSRKDLNVSFNPGLETIQPPIRINPLGFQYDYPDPYNWWWHHWHKQELEINGNSKSFNYLKNFSVYFKLNALFDETFSGKCTGHDSDWHSWSSCSSHHHHNYCLYLTMTIEDKNGSRYTYPCGPMQLDDHASITINLKDPIGDVNFEFGGHSRQLMRYYVDAYHYDYGYSNITANTSIEFTFNTTNFYATIDSNLTTNDSGLGVSMRQQLSQD